MTARVELVNPLPLALHHYQDELRDVLEAAGVDVTVAATTSAERQQTGRPAAEVLRHCLRDRLVAAGPPPGVHRLVLWPVLGYPELLMWRGPSRNTSIVFHDPAPLRRQVGLSRGAARSTRAAGALGRTRGLVVHSPTALAEVHERGYDADLLPHPVLAPVARPATEPSRQVLVLGQHKEARDLELLPRLAPLLRARGLTPRIVGRGWPEVPGWEVDPRFVDEEEFVALIRDSALVLLPYTRVFQSGVAVQAAEHAVPVVGGAATNVAEMYGVDWPGLVPDHGRSGATADDWVVAVERVLGLTPAHVLPSVSDYRERAVRAWGDWAGRLRPGG